MGPPNPPLLGPSVLVGTPPCVYLLRGSAPSLAYRPVSGFGIIYNRSSSSLTNIVLFRFFLNVFKMHLGRGFHTLIKNILFSSSTDVESHNSPSFGASVLSGTRSLLQLMWDPSIHPLQGPMSLLAHRLVSTPFRVQHPRWHIAQCLALIPFVTMQSHRWQMLSSLGFPFRAFSSRFLKCVC